MLWVKIRWWWLWNAILGRYCNSVLSWGEKSHASIQFAIFPWRLHIWTTPGAWKEWSVFSSHDPEHCTRFLHSALRADFCGTTRLGVVLKIPVIGLASPIYFYLHNLCKEESFCIILVPGKPTVFYTGGVHCNSISEVFLVNYHKDGELV